METAQQALTKTTLVIISGWSLGDTHNDKIKVFSEVTGQ